MKNQSCQAKICFDQTLFGYAKTVSQSPFTRPRAALRDGLAPSCFPPQAVRMNGRFVAAPFIHLASFSCSFFFLLFPRLLSLQLQSSSSILVSGRQISSLSLVFSLSSFMHRLALKSLAQSHPRVCFLCRFSPSLFAFDSRSHANCHRSFNQQQSTQDTPRMAQYARSSPATNSRRQSGTLLTTSPTTQ